MPEILILGCGKRMGRVSKELRDYLRSNGIKLEAIDTVTTYL
jgi:NADH dehydrogenase [ubiquinone] 1 alpha subcomplex assembly factor 3